MTGAVERRRAVRPSPTRAAARVLAATIAVACATPSPATETFRVASEAPPGEGVASGQGDLRSAPRGSPPPAREVTPPARGRAPGEPQAGCYDRTRCIEQVKVKLGTECGSSDSMKVVWRNACDDDVKAVVCFVRPDGTLECGQSRIRAGREQTDWACHATAVNVAAFHVDDSYRCAENEKKRWAERPGS